MKRHAAWVWALCAMLVFPVAAQERPYTDGPVMQVASIKIQAGHFDEYMRYLAGTWIKEQEALKEAGIILDYAVYAATARSPKDADVYLATTYANWAALDGLDARSDPVIAKALGTNRQQDMKAMAERNAYREVLGVENVQQLKFK